MKLHLAELVYNTIKIISMNVKNISASTLPEFLDKFADIINDGLKPTLAIVFSDPEIENKQVAKILEDHSVEYIAGSSSGEIVQGNLYKKSISASLFEIDKSKFKIHRQDLENESSIDAGTQLANLAIETFQNPGFISILTMKVNGEHWLKGLKDTLGKDPLIYGGLASDDSDLNPYVFTSKEYNYSSFHTIILDSDQIEIDGFAIAGWEAIGTEHEITKSKDNVLYEINNEPALDFFKKFFGFDEDPLNVDVSAHVNSQYPLQLERENETVLRSPMGADVNEKSLLLAGPVNEGEKFRFSVAPGFSVINETVEKFKEFKKDKEVPDAMILFSCKARHWAFGPMIEEEVKALHKLWEIPFQGFFSFGEIGKNSTGSTQYFNETCCLVTLKEK